MTSSFQPRRVLCALDLSESIDDLLDTAVSLAARFKADLQLLHVWMPWAPTVPDTMFVPTGDGVDAMARELEEKLEAAAQVARRAHPHVETWLVAGRPWEQIVLFAESNDCDLIVAGTHGRTGIARLMVGSVAERVVRESHVPVLVVPRSVTTASIHPERDEDARAAAPPEDLS